ncbi:MAG TPA: YncE family protein [Mycobacterium sp.]|uniref:YncE family protein n=1 Tax=Mycolicibacterium sp. TaxID=2320850 RepID=UPI0025DDC4C8|nr:YncE family protein [Mycolicibacterium sp.]HPX35629.1 YncE family protein [Mycobacterium sp.]HQC75945.1 YncE family protein [Mycobacterium sp.]
MANTMGASAVAERSSDALWLAALPVPRVTATKGRLPAMRHTTVRPAEGVLSALPGAVTDMAVSPDGGHLVAAHYGDDAVSVIDIATLTVRTVIDDIAEPYAIAAADRIYVTSAADAEDSVVAVDPNAGVALAAKDITVTARGLAVSPAGDVLFVARCGDAGADIAAIDVESGVTRSIALTGAAGATVDTIRVSADGNTLYAALTTVADSALMVIDLRSGRIAHRVAIRGSIGDIAAHRDGRRVFVTGWDVEQGGTLTVVDAVSGRVTGTVALGGPATQVVLSGTRAYVVSGDDVSVVDIVAALRVVDTFEIGRPVSCVALSRDESCLYVADYEGSITALSAAAAAQLRAAS